MAFLDFHFHSECLAMSTSCYVIMPQSTMSQIGMTGVGTPDGCPVLYLLHGMSDDHTIWLRRTSIERYASQYGLAVVMPNAERSYYANMQNQMRYWDFVSQEIPALIGSFFKVSQKREDTFVAGLSMGGHGALKLALNCPDKFAACGAFSSAVSAEHLASVVPDRKAEFEGIFGDLSNIKGTYNDLYYMAEKQKKAGMELPRLFMAVGTEDFLYEENLRYKAHLEKLGIPFTWHTEPGTHEWGFWDRQIQNFLKFAFNK